MIYPNFLIRKSITNAQTGQTRLVRDSQSDWSSLVTTEPQKKRRFIKELSGTEIRVYRTPKSGTEVWIVMARSKAVNRALKSLGWHQEESTSQAERSRRACRPPVPRQHRGRGLTEDSPTHVPRRT